MAAPSPRTQSRATPFRYVSGRNRSQSVVVRGSKSHIPLSTSFSLELLQLEHERTSTQSEIASLRQNERRRRLSISSNRLSKESDYAKINADYWRTQITGARQRRYKRNITSPRSAGSSPCPVDSNVFASHLCVLLEEIRLRTQDLSMLNDSLSRSVTEEDALANTRQKLLDRQSIFRTDATALCEYGFKASDFTLLSLEYERVIRNVTEKRPQPVDEFETTEQKVSLESSAMGASDLFRKIDDLQSENERLRDAVEKYEKNQKRDSMNGAINIDRISDLSLELECESKVSELHDQYRLEDRSESESESESEKEKEKVQVVSVADAEECEEDAKRLKIILASETQTAPPIQNDLEELMKRLSDRETEVDVLELKVESLELRNREMSATCHEAHQEVTTLRHHFDRERRKQQQEIRSLELMLDRERESSHDTQSRLSGTSTELQRRWWNSGIVLDDVLILRWANAKMKGKLRDGKSYEDLTDLSHEAFVSGMFYLDLMSCIKPSAVDWGRVVEDDNTESDPRAGYRNNLNYVLELLHSANIQMKGLDVAKLVEGHSLAVLYLLCRIRVWASKKRRKKRG